MIARIVPRTSKMEFRKKIFFTCSRMRSISLHIVYHSGNDRGERRRQSHNQTMYWADSLQHRAACSPARWKQHVNQTTLRNRRNMIFQHLKNTFFTSIISTACVVVFLFKKKHSKKSEFFFFQ